MIATKRFAITHRLYVFGLIWFGQTISVIGSSLTGFALIVWVYQRTGSTTQLALVSFFAFLPSIVLAPISGALADRWDRRRVMILSDIGAALGTLVLWLLLIADSVEIWHVYLVVIFVSTCNDLQIPAYTAVTTLLVPKKHLGRANGMVQLGSAMAPIVSPMLAGVLMVTIGIQGVILIDLSTFFFAVLTLFVVQVPKPETTIAGQEEKGSLLREAVYGWTYIKTRPGLLGLLPFFAAVNFTQIIVVVLINALVLSFADASALGSVISIAGCGMLFGALAMSAWGGLSRRVNGVLVFTLLRATLLLLGGLKPSVPLIAAAAFMFFFCTQIIIASSQALWQSKVAPSVQGRVFAVRQMITWVTIPLAYLSAGPLSDGVFEPLLAADGPLAGSIGQIIGTGPGRGIGLLFITLGVLNVLIAIGAYLYPRIRLLEDELPDAISDDASIALPFS